MKGRPERPFFSTQLHGCFEAGQTSCRAVGADAQ